MKAAFDTLVRPAYIQLSKDLGVTAVVDDNSYVIPVTVKFPSGTTQIIEDGMMAECDHAGADMGDVDLQSLYYDPISGSVTDIDDEHYGLVCDQCPAWQDEAGEWHE